MDTSLQEIPNGIKVVQTMRELIKSYEEQLRIKNQLIAAQEDIIKLYEAHNAELIRFSKQQIIYK